MRVAVVGSGSMGGMHARLLAGMAEVDSLLVVDADAERAAQVAMRNACRVATFDEALAEADAIVIATPPALHVAEVEAAIAAGLHVLCEKPLADTLAASIALTQRIEEAGAHVEVGFQRRHDAAFREAREAIDGRVHLVKLTAHDPVLTPLTAAGEPPEMAPIFRDSSVHDFDLVRWLTGQEVTDVQVEAGRRDGRPPADVREIESAIVSMRLSDGTLAVLDAMWLQPLGYDIRVEIVSEGSAISAGLSPRTPVRPVEGPPAAEPWHGYLERFEPAYRAELSAFLACCRAAGPPGSTARDGLEAMRVAMAATRAFSEARRVSLDEIPGLARVPVA